MAAGTGNKMKRSVFLLWLIALLVSLPTANVWVRTSNGAVFTATELLGRPTDSSVVLNVLSEQTLETYFEFGTESGVYTNQTSVMLNPGSTPFETVIGGLKSDTRYYYRMVCREVGATDWTRRAEHYFQTQRKPGGTFTFTVTSDSHLNFFIGNSDVYRRTLLNVLDDSPDFHIDLGDTFQMYEVTDMAQASQVYLAQREYLGIIGHSVPIFLALGNHEDEEGWNLDDTPSLPLLSVNTRKQFCPNPVPDGFYSGNTDASLTAISGDHLREDYYSWSWGDALFVVIDPFWYTLTKPYVAAIAGEKGDEAVIGDRWDWTLGEQQYRWFKQTLEDSNATFKFVFSHQVTGGTEPYGRCGAEAAPFFEWGGNNWNGSWGFDAERSGWVTPIHQLMVENGVTVFFHGHDHEFAMEERDGVVYQLCPMASDITYGYGFGLYHEADPYTKVVLPNSGHLRVTVSSSQVKVDYVRAFLSGGTNKAVAYSYTLPTPTIPEFPAALVLVLFLMGTLTLVFVRRREERHLSC